jgi:hypothetical protein
MEGAPQYPENNIENISDWRTRKAEAPRIAAKYVESIEGYQNLGVEGKIVKLNELFTQLEASNDNRFIAEVVSLYRESLELEEAGNDIEARQREIRVRLAA